MGTDDLRYDAEHFWLKIEGDKTTRIGITPFYCEQLQRIIFVDLPELNAVVSKGQPFGSIESPKTISDLNSPISGKVVAVHSEVSERGDIVSGDPYGEGWLFIVEMSDSAELGSLMSAREYDSFVMSLRS